VAWPMCSRLWAAARISQRAPDSVRFGRTIVASRRSSVISPRRASTSRSVASIRATSASLASPVTRNAAFAVPREREIRDGCRQVPFRIEGVDDERRDRVGLLARLPVEGQDRQPATNRSHGGVAFVKERRDVGGLGWVGHLGQASRCEAASCRPQALTGRGGQPGSVEHGRTPGLSALRRGFASPGRDGREPEAESPGLSCLNPRVERGPRVEARGSPMKSVRVRDDGRPAGPQRARDPYRQPVVP